MCQIFVSNMYMYCKMMIIFVHNISILTMYLTKYNYGTPNAYDWLVER